LSTSREESGATAFVVRDGGSWLLAPVPVSLPVAVELHEVLALLDDAPALEEVPSLDVVRDTYSAEPLAMTTVVAPVWMWVGLVTASGVALEGNDARVIVLDRDDLRLLDAIAAPIAVHDLVEITGVHDAPVRLGRLVAAGRLRALTVDEAEARSNGA
jgi:hypothetical protein